MNAQCTGLSKDETDRIREVLGAVESLEKAVLFGSRAMGLARYNSDIDLMLYGAGLTSDDAAKIGGALDESTLPYMFDLIIYDESNNALNEHIRQYGKVIYEKGKDGWGRVRLGEVITFQRGYDLPKKQMKYGKYPVVGSNGIIGYHNEYTTEAPSITIGRSGNTGNPFIVYGRSWSHNTTLYIKEFKECDPVYIYYLLKTLDLSNFAGGSAVPTLNRNHIHTLEITMPPLSEQIEIGRMLRVLDDKIANNSAINRCLEQMARGVFAERFGDREPNGVLSDIASDIICGKTPSTKVKEYYGNDIPFITIPDMHGTVYVTSTERSLSEAGAKSQNSKTVPPNSVCVSCIATAGLVALTSVPSQTNQQINTIICKAGISPYFIYLTMVGMADYIRMLGSSGSATNNLNKGQFSKIELAIPNSHEMNSFKTTIEPLFETIKHNQQESINLAALRDSLLPRLMSGELSAAVTINALTGSAGVPPAGGTTSPPHISPPLP